jgi:outer membrane protein TolC
VERQGRLRRERRDQLAHLPPQIQRSRPRGDSETFLASKQSYRDLWNQVQADIRSIAFDAETIREQITCLKPRCLPQAEQSLRSGESAYASGEGGVLDLLDSQRMLLEIRLGLAQLRSDYLKSVAELERAIGAP